MNSTDARNGLAIKSCHSVLQKVRGICLCAKYFQTFIYFRFLSKHCKEYCGQNMTECFCFDFLKKEVLVAFGNQFNCQGGFEGSATLMDSLGDQLNRYANVWAFTLNIHESFVLLWKCLFEQKAFDQQKSRLKQGCWGVLVYFLKAFRFKLNILIAHFNLINPADWPYHIVAADLWRLVLSWVLKLILELRITEVIERSTA